MQLKTHHLVILFFISIILTWALKIRAGLDKSLSTSLDNESKNNIAYIHAAAIVANVKKQVFVIFENKEGKQKKEKFLKNQQGIRHLAEIISLNEERSRPMVPT